MEYKGPSLLEIYINNFDIRNLYAKIMQGVQSNK